MEVIQKANVTFKKEKVREITDPGEVNSFQISIDNIETPYVEFTTKEWRTIE